MNSVGVNNLFIKIVDKKFYGVKYSYYIYSMKKQVSFADVDFDKGWAVCKKYGKTRGLSKSSIRMMRPGYVGMWLLDLERAGLLTEDDYNNLK